MDSSALAALLPLIIGFFLFRFVVGILARVLLVVLALAVGLWIFDSASAAGFFT